LLVGNRLELPREMMHAEVCHVGAEFFRGDREVDRLQERVGCRAGL
jgi:hypothetical protein